MSDVLVNVERKDVPLRFEDLENEAQKHLDKNVFDYEQSGAGIEETLRSNREAFSNWKIVPRVMRDVSTVSLHTTINGQSIPAPILLAPVGMQGISHPDGELASAAASAKYEVPFIASTVSSYTLEEIAEANGNGKRWFQLYYPNNVEIAKSFVKRAEIAGYEAIVITVDMPLIGNRERDRSNQYSPFLLGAGKANYAADPVFQEYLAAKPGAAVLDEMLQTFYRPGLNWEDMKPIRDAVDLPIYLKGILHPDDAEEAVKHGIDGIVVSNHGGRQLDGCIATLDALPLIKERVKDKLPILLDSGVRSGPDIFKALALGADAVLLGRPFLYGLTIAGQSGVEQVIQNVLHDLKTTMSLSGIKSIQEINANAIRKTYR
ncbi:alpha-hydroxy-acid oxidizing enzyme [Oceanobacillus zhaokaii]|uniref:L-lactate oxidase n=1 Tax=Oceanobacillus zhaokaii TaxID=2052660 RepID=A0A345PK24_9BACI|nr:alpha-hydroxy-acid oxidizing protein [Oceanobacillus zhaokaii]AXI10354.1 alpha-hydroxy-acid oxidizing enzyme [Oceanobacillus zhaokaii]